MSAPRQRQQVTNDANLRGQGAIVGFLVASAFVAAGLVTAGPGVDVVMVTLTDGVPTLVAGTLGGWLLAPRAERASTRRDWLGVVVLLGIVAVVVGALGMGIAMGFESGVRSGGGVGQLFLMGIVGGLFAGAIGIVILGWMILPLTTLAAGIWAVVMARLLRRTPGRSR